MLDVVHSLPPEISEEQARRFLAGFNGHRPTIRALAEQWGWSKSRVDRFLSQQGAGQDAGQAPRPDEPSLEQRRQLLIAAVKAFDAKYTETAEQIVDRMMLDEPDPVKAADPSEPGEEDLAIAGQAPIWIYRNTFDDVAIRADHTMYGADAVVITVNPHNVPALIAKLQAVADEIEADKA